ncbi:hypothetical protein RZS08_53335, partial [Arthrospira platensis SPKY1]|nr:hypothetical protein [Arthrospira platensis SPKY1]
MVEEKSFREDLYYRLNVMRILLPSLRERSDDIPALVDFMLQRLRKQRKTKVTQLSPEAMALMKKYPWPGNVRELENVVHRSAVIVKGETILPRDLPRELQAMAEKAPTMEDPAEVGAVAAPIEVEEQP